ncbi:hypothetical protein ACFXKC_52825 [Streptomyces sp. NPDC059340]|uniref:hypothetical protein n=1 Tax=Streptomyces sp. NPDC059340 TaxID=3346806 RepID=UPI0036826BF3
MTPRPYYPHKEEAVLFPSTIAHQPTLPFVVSGSAVFSEECPVALRNQVRSLDIVAAVIRQDSRWARLHNDAYFARFACANFTYDHDHDEPG